MGDEEVCQAYWTGKRDVEFAVKREGTGGSAKNKLHAIVSTGDLVIPLELLSGYFSQRNQISLVLLVPCPLTFQGCRRLPSRRVGATATQAGGVTKVGVPEAGATEGSGAATRC